MVEGVVSTESYKCGSCGGTVCFDPETQNLKCEYCRSITAFEVNEVEIKSYSLEDGLEHCDTDWQQETRVIHCDSCGADTILDGNNTSQLCAFCDSTHVTDIENQPGIKPELLIPFKISEDKARQLFKKWIKGKFFAKGEAKKSNRIANIAGIYLPYWVFNTDTSTQYWGRRGTTVQTGSGKNRQTTTHWSNVSGTYFENFRDVTICGSDQIEKMGLSKKLDFKYEELQGYDPGFLSGFIAEKYIRGVENSWERCKQKINDFIRRGIKREIGGDKQEITSMDTHYANTRYKHVLCPVWMSVYKFQGKEFPFVVNGQTGKIEGKYPLSIPKVAGAVAAAALIIYILIRLFA